MANLALIRGAAAAAPKFTDIRAAVEPGIRRLEKIAAIRQREQEKRELNDKREEALDAQAYAQFPALVTDGVPEAWLGYYTEQAGALKDEAYALSQNRRNMEPIEFIDAQRRLKGKIAKMQEAANWIKTYAAEEQADIDEGLERSDSYTEDERELHLKILAMDPSIVPTMLNDQPAIQYTTDEGDVITKKLSDIKRLQRKEYAKDNEIQGELDSFLSRAAKAEKFPGDPEFDQLLESKINSLELSKHEARSLAIDVFGIGGKRGQDAALIPAIQPDIMKQFDANQDGEIDKDEYLTFINSIQSVDELKNIVKEQYKQSAITTGNEYKKAWQDKQAKIAKSTKGGLTAAQQLKEMKERQEYSDRVTLAAQDLGKINFKDINSISTAAGGKVLAIEPDDENNPYPGGKTIIINDKIVIPEDMPEVDKIRKIIEARVQNKMLEQSDVPNLLMSLKITGEEMVIAPPTPSELLAKYSTQNKQ